MEKEKKEEVFIVGEVVSHPVATFSDINNGGSVMGWVFKLKTQQFVDYEVQEKIININVVYDMKRWSLLRKGQSVKLSVLRKQKSEFTDDGLALKCNIVFRS